MAGTYCANQNDPTFQALEALHGKEKAQLFWNTYEGNIDPITLDVIRDAKAIEDEIIEKGLSGVDAEIYMKQQREQLLVETLAVHNTDPKIKKAMDLIETRIKTLELMNVGDDENQILARDNRLRELKTYQKDLKKNATYLKVLEAGNSLLEWMNEDLTKELINDTDLVQNSTNAAIILQMVDDLIENTTPEDEWEEGPKTNTELVKQASALREGVAQAVNKLTKLSMESIVNRVKDTTHVFASKQDLESIPEINIFESQFVHLTRIDSKLAGLVGTLLQNMEANAIAMYSEGHAKQIDDALKVLKDNNIDIEKKENRDKLMQLDNKGRRTTNFITRYTAEYEESYSRSM